MEVSIYIIQDHIWWHFIMDYRDLFWKKMYNHQLKKNQQIYWDHGRVEILQILNGLLRNKNYQQKIKIIQWMVYLDKELNYEFVKEFI